MPFTSGGAQPSPWQRGMHLIALLGLMASLQTCKPSPPVKVSISGENLSLEQLFTEITQQTGIEFFYQSSLLEGTKPVTLHIEKRPVDEVLSACLPEQGLGFNIRSNTIVVFKQEDKP